MPGHFPFLVHDERVRNAVDAELLHVTVARLALVINRNGPSWITNDNIWDNQNNLTRWQVVVNSIKTITQDGSYLSQNTHLALMRFGHDPNAAQAGTLIPNDSSGITDGQKLDVPWYDAQNDPWYECNGAAIGAALDAAGDPINGSLVGVGTWTKGALDYAKTLINQSVADHPEDNGERIYLNVVVTDGAWTSVDGTQTLAPAGQNPALTAADLFDNQGISTYVVAVAGDPNAEMAADSLAVAGGTGPTAIDGDTPVLLEQALAGLVQSIIDDLVAPECVGGLPRIMVLLDASSSMLNINGGTMAGGAGTTGWDKARDALAGDVDSLFDLELVNLPGQAVEDVVHLGLAVFGHNAPAPGEQKLLVQYGPCQKDNFAWALDPNTSCEMPGCDDPWGGPPITWTFKDGSMIDPPGFDKQTLSAMPQCGGNNAFCSGSGTYTHLGLDLINTNRVNYFNQCSQMGAEFPCDANTQFINILITDGQYSGYSTDAQVQTELTQMFNAGITTYVIGFGDGVDTPAAIQQLNNMADWGSGNANDYYDANNQAALEQALSDIIASIQFDPCCAFNDCSENPEPTTREPDPIPSDDTTTDPSTTTGTETGTTDDPTTTETDTATTDPTTAETGTTDDPTTADTGTEGTTTSTTSDTNGDGMDEVGTEDTGGTDGTGGTGEDDGCNCSVPDSDEGKARGLAGSFLLLGLAGLIRRRRR